MSRLRRVAADARAAFDDPLEQVRAWCRWLDSLPLPEVEPPVKRQAKQEAVAAKLARAAAPARDETPEPPRKETGNPFVWRPQRSREDETLTAWVREWKS